MNHSNESTENYLEAILVLQGFRPVVRSVDIANFLGFTKPSVSIAMKKLRENEYIEVSPEGFITLTDSRSKIASTIYERHQLLTTWLVRLGVNEDIASEDACRMEHVISPESFEAIRKHATNMSKQM